MFDRERHHRRSIRMAGYDYARNGAYFVTICVKNRLCLFGDVVEGKMRRNEAGRIVEHAWRDLPNHNAGIALDAFVVMPNHVHGIIIITGGGPASPGADSGRSDCPVGAGSEPAPTAAQTRPAGLKHHGLPEIIRQFKTFSALRINRLRGTPGVSVWQRNYYEHIIRGSESLYRIRQYIHTNPARWAFDHDNPRRTKPIHRDP